MGKMPVLPKDGNHLESRPPCLPDASLPIFYMSDYSVMGLLVSNFQEAIQILEENEFSVTRESNGTQVLIDNAAHVRKIFQVFKKHDIKCEIADVVDQVYQG
jgi:hypothetical protein